MCADDLVSLESLAVTYAKMYKFDKAADLLDKLVSSHTDDFEAWRLLGETNLLSARPQRAIAAYEKAVALDANDQQVLTVSSNDTWYQCIRLVCCGALGHRACGVPLCVLMLSANASA